MREAGGLTSNALAPPQGVPLWYDRGRFEPIGVKGGSNEKAPRAVVRATLGATSGVGSTGLEPVTSTMST